MSKRKPLETLSDDFATPDIERTASKRASATAPAAELLLRMLSAGPVKVCDIEAAAKSAGMSMRTVERAKRRLGIKADRSGKGWCWSLPQDRQGKQATLATQTVIEPVTPAPPVEQPPPAPSGPSVPMGLVRSRYGTIEPPRLVPLWAAMGRKRLS